MRCCAAHHTHTQSVSDGYWRWNPAAQVQEPSTGWTGCTGRVPDVLRGYLRFARLRLALKAAQVQVGGKARNLLLADGCHLPPSLCSYIILQSVRARTQTLARTILPCNRHSETRREKKKKRI